MSDSIIERLRHHARDERNTAFARSTMREAEGHIERLSNDLFDVLDCKNGTGPTALSLVIEERDSLRAELAACREREARMQWQPIETAPRGSGENGPNSRSHPDYVEPPKILLLTQEGPVVGYYDWYYHPGYGRGAEEGEPAWRDSSGGPAYGPTHWMHLPAALAEGAQG